MLSNAENRDKFRSELTENFEREDVKEHDVKPCEQKRKPNFFNTILIEKVSSKGHNYVKNAIERRKPRQISLRIDRELCVTEKK